MSGLPESFAAKTMQSTCTVWIGATNASGYGVVQIAGALHLAHRVAYEAERGPLPAGIVLDHLCRVRNCVRVEHLDPVTTAENNRRGRLAAALAVGDTCTNGHRVETAADLYVRPSGKTECCTCRAISNTRGNGRRRPTTQRQAGKVRAAVTTANRKAS